LNNTYTIAALVLTIAEARGGKALKTFNIYVNNRTGGDLTEMKKDWNLWKRIKSVNVEPSDTEVKVSFPVPITASNILLEYQSIPISRSNPGQTVYNDGLYDYLPADLRPKF
jgi:hypothetical protein